MQIEIPLTNEESADLRLYTGVDDASAALRIAVLEYLRYARRTQCRAAPGGVVIEGPSHAAVQAAIEQVRRITEEIFGNVVSIEETCDMKDETWRIVVVRAEDRGEVDAMVGRFNAWHGRLSEVPREVRGLFRLSPIITDD